MRLVSLLSAVSAGCAHTVFDDDGGRSANLADNNVINEDGLNTAICEHESGSTSSDGSCPEMDLPRTMSSPFMCPLARTSPGGHALCLQCAVKPGMKADSALLHYRRPGEGQWSWQSQPMRRTPSGWFRGTIPALVVSGYELEVFFEALDGIDQVATDGEWNSPHVIVICGGRK